MPRVENGPFRALRQTFALLAFAEPLRLRFTEPLHFSRFGLKLRGRLYGTGGIDHCVETFVSLAVLRRQADVEFSVGVSSIARVTKRGRGLRLNVDLYMVVGSRWETAPQVSIAGRRDGISRTRRGIPCRRPEMKEATDQGAGRTGS